MTAAQTLKLITSWGLDSTPVTNPKTVYKVIDRRVRIARNNESVGYQQFTLSQYAEAGHLERFAAAALACRTVELRAWA